jgi:hypothetical protein
MPLRDMERAAAAAHTALLAQSTPTAVADALEMDCDTRAMLRCKQSA